MHSAGTHYHKKVVQIKIIYRNYTNHGTILFWNRRNNHKSCLVTLKDETWLPRPRLSLIWHKHEFVRWRPMAAHLQTALKQGQERVTRGALSCSQNLRHFQSTRGRPCILHYCTESARSHTPLCRPDKLPKDAVYCLALHLVQNARL